jgi:hypothetical protein
MQRGALSSVLLAILAVAAFAKWGPSPGHIWQLFSTVSPTTWLIATGGMLASYCVRGLRLHAEWRSRLPVARLECIQLAILHTAAVNVVPFRGGEASYPLMVKHRWNVPLLRASLSLAWLRLQDMMIVSSVAIIVFFPGSWYSAMLVVFALWLLAYIALRAAKREISRPTGAYAGTRPPSTKWRGRLHKAAQTLADAVSESRGGRMAWVFAAMNWTIKLSVLAFLLNSVTPLTLLSSVGGGLGGEFASALPVQPLLGAGTYEAGVLFGMAATGTALDAGLQRYLGAAIVLHVFLISLSSVAGLLVLLWVRLGGSITVPAKADA